MTVIIEVKDLVKVYNGTIRAVDGITFDVAEGEVFGFLRPNGASQNYHHRGADDLAAADQRHVQGVWY